MKYEKTARRLKTAMDECGMKAQELADKAKISKSSVSQYINGSHKPSNINADKMAGVLGVNPLWLMGFDAEKKADVHPDGQPIWYLDDEAAAFALEFLTDPEKRALLDSVRKLKPDDVRLANELLKRFKETNPDG